MNNAEYINLNVLTERRNKIMQENKQSYNNILARIHKKIIVTSRQRNYNTYLMYQVPSLVMGNSHYNLAECIEYITIKLSENGFVVNYIDNCYILITWYHITNIQQAPQSQPILQSIPIQQTSFKIAKPIPTDSVFYNFTSK
jgi:hypothetical protein